MAQSNCVAECYFITRVWENITQIQNLPKRDICGNTVDPNNVKLGKGFSSDGRKIANIFAIDDFGKPNHIAERQKGSLVRPEYREVPVAHVARERTRLPFDF